jgi:DNA-binding response OmpR family regulator
LPWLSGPVEPPVRSILGKENALAATVAGTGRRRKRQMAQARLLVVEDDYSTRELTRNVLEKAGYIVSVVSDGPEALKKIEQQGLPSLLLLDLGLPSMHGFEVAARVKKMADVPIIILTGMADKKLVIQGLREYADDYITKPFDADEMLVRVQRVLSRVGTAAHPPQPLIVVDDHLAIDFAGNRVVLDGESNPLTPTESAILSVLYRQRGKVVANETLMARVWPGEEVFEDRLRVHVFRLRTKLRSPVSGETYVVTERGVGYSFSVPNEHVLNKPR